MTPEEINEAVAKRLEWKLDRIVTGIDSQGNEVENKEWITPMEGKKYQWNVPDYCTDIGAAWEIIQWLKTDYQTGSLANIVLRYDVIRLWVFGFSDSRDRLNAPIWYEAEADTAPMAICLAFLKMGKK